MKQRSVEAGCGYYYVTATCTKLKSAAVRRGAVTLTGSADLTNRAAR